MSCYFIVNLTDEHQAVQWLNEPWSSTLFLVILPVITTIGFINNFILVFTVFRVPRMRTRLNSFMVNLAISDTLFLLTSALGAVPYYDTSIRRIDKPAKSPLECLAFDSLIFIWYFTSLTFATLVTVERYFAICQPFRHRYMITKWILRATNRIIFTWLCGVMLMAINVPYFLVDGTEHCLLWPNIEEYDSFPSSYTVCRFNRDSSIPVDNESLAVFIVWELSFVVPVIMNSTLSILIVRAICLRVRRRQQMHSNQKDHGDKQIAMTIVVTTTLIFFCKFPWHLYHLDAFIYNYTDGAIAIWPGKQHDGVSENKLSSIAIAGLVINSGFNPWIYALGSRVYRNAFAEALGVKIPKLSCLKRTVNMATVESIPVNNIIENRANEGIGQPTNDERRLENTRL